MKLGSKKEEIIRMITETISTDNIQYSISSHLGYFRWLLILQYLQMNLEITMTSLNKERKDKKDMV